MIEGVRALGASGTQVSTVGLGCMGLSEFYGAPADHQAATRLLHAAVERGVDHFDTAEAYGMGHNESLLGDAFRDRPKGITIATKFGPMRDSAGQFIGVDGSPENVRRASEGSLRRLRVDAIDLYYLHRMDRNVPIEETVGAMSRLIEEGKARMLGLSEASVTTLRRAHAVYPITALQSEYSLFSRDIEGEILPACLELGISLVAYSPLGRGLLTGRYASEADRPSGDDDRRAAGLPRFEADNFASNLRLVERVKAVADRRDSSPAQVALAWVLGRAENIVSIPGTTKLKNLDINLGALAVDLTEEDLTDLDELVGAVQGERYDEGGMAAVNL